jgi:hypothetical protein
MPRDSGEAGRASERNVVVGERLVGHVAAVSRSAAHAVLAAAARHAGAASAATTE